MSAAADTIASLRRDGSTIIAVGAVMMVAATTAVALRLAAKSRNENRFGLDDLMIGLSLAIFLAVESMVLRSVVVGSLATGSTDPNYSMFLKLSYVYSLLYWSVIASAMTSILFLYRRIFSSHKAFRTASAILIALSAGWWLSGTLADALAYQPVRAYWDSSVAGNYSIEYNDFWLTSMIIEMLLETACLILPIREVAKLRLSTRKKIYVTIIFLMGGLVLISGIVRIYYAWGQNDMTPGVIWLSVHTAVAIISACLPTYRPLLSRVTGLASSIRHYDYGSRRTSQPHRAGSDMKELRENKARFGEGTPEQIRMKGERNHESQHTMAADGNEASGVPPINGQPRQVGATDKWTLQLPTELEDWPLGRDSQHTRRAVFEELDLSSDRL